MFRLLMSAFILVLMLGCNKTTTTPAPEDSVKSAKLDTSIFPHEKDFFKNHGLKYSDNKKQCLSCHGSDGSGGTAKVSCLSCHQNFPHPDNWVMPAKHSTAYLKNPQSCSSCHGADWQGGKSKVSCQTCHQGFPHSNGFALPKNHGKAFLAAKDKKDCMSCHDLAKNPTLATRCDSCHKAFPHPEGFSSGQAHKAIAKTYDGKCLSCHVDYKANMPTLAESGGCLACHDGYTLEIGWKEVPTPTPTDSPTGAIIKKKDRLPSSPHQPKKK